MTQKELMIFKGFLKAYSSNLYNDFYVYHWKYIAGCGRNSVTVSFDKMVQTSDNDLLRKDFSSGLLSNSFSWSATDNHTFWEIASSVWARYYRYVINPAILDTIFLMRLCGVDRTTQDNIGIGSDEPSTYYVGTTDKINLEISLERISLFQSNTIQGAAVERSLKLSRAGIKINDLVKTHSMNTEKFTVRFDSVQKRNDMIGFLIGNGYRRVVAKRGLIKRPDDINGLTIRDGTYKLSILTKSDYIVGSPYYMRKIKGLVANVEQVKPTIENPTRQFITAVTDLYGNTILRDDMVNLRDVLDDVELHF